jgi:hypothetical protein
MSTALHKGLPADTVRERPRPVRCPHGRGASAVRLRGHTESEWHTFAGWLPDLLGHSGPAAGSGQAWKLQGVAAFRFLDWRLESEALRRSLLEYSLIFYTRWTELKLDKHIQLRIVHCLLRQLSLQLPFV